MRTFEEIYGALAGEFAARTGQEAGRSEELSARLYAVAAQVCALEAQAEWTGRQCFPQTAAGEFLDRHAQLRGLERRPAARSEGILRFSAGRMGTGSLAIPEGTVCMTAGLLRFETTREAVLPAGEPWVDVPARAAEAGAAGNVPAGSVLMMAVAPVGIGACANPEPFSGGTDTESDEALRERVLETYRRLPNGANAAFYEQGALSFPEVVAAAVLPKRRGAGTVDVVIATRTGAPSLALRNQVKEYFASRREIAVDVAVVAPATKIVNITASIAPEEGRSFEEVRAAATAAVTAWFNGTRLGKKVLLAQLGALLFGVDGVANYQIAAPAADVTITANQIPKLGSLTLTEMGG